MIVPLDWTIWVQKLRLVRLLNCFFVPKHEGGFILYQVLCLHDDDELARKATAGNHHFAPIARALSFHSTTILDSVCFHY